MGGMYDTSLLQRAMENCGFNFYQLGLAAGVDEKTAKKIVTTGQGNPTKAFLVAKALGLPVKRRNLSAIIFHETSERSRKSA